MATLSKTAEKVYNELCKVPPGKVTTYGALARKCGLKSARQIGMYMRLNPYAPKVPCHRVIMSDGKLGGYNGGITKKIKLLKQEGVEVKNGKIADVSKIAP